MSRFYSDMITWSTFGVGLAAVLLGNVDLEPAGAPTEEREVLVASVETGADIAVYADALARTEPEALRDIPQAVLETVTFTATGSDNSTLQPVAQEATGTVTADAVNLRAGPGTGFAVVGRAVRDQKLVVTGNTDGIWIEVTLTDSPDPAWVHGKYFVAPEVNVLAQN